MADHGELEYATAEGNDLPAHEEAYERFVHLVVVLGGHATSIVLALAIGGVADHWLVAILIMAIATGVAIHGFLTGARMPTLVMVCVSLLALALTSGG
jgi:hypothetical protein